MTVVTDDQLRLLHDWKREHDKWAAEVADIRAYHLTGTVIYLGSIWLLVVGLAALGSSLIWGGARFAVVGALMAAVGSCALWLTRP